jgi:hypothetical protein
MLTIAAILVLVGVRVIFVVRARRKDRDGRGRKGSYDDA